MVELDEATEQAVKILAEEAHKGTISTASVIEQLQGQGQEYRPLIYFYLRVMWKGLDKDGMPLATRRLFRRSMDEGRAMVEDHADVAVTIFADYDRDLLLEFLEASEVYDYNKAATICEKKSFIPELVVVLSRTGQTRRALELIISELGDASKAIAFVRQNPDLWDDLLEYGMDKPKFIRGLLAEVGTSIDPVKLIQRMPSKLEIPGLKDGILSLVHAWELQLEVSKGVDRVLRGEVLAGMNTLREGQKRGLRFEVVHQDADEVEVSVAVPPTNSEDTLPTTDSTAAQPGRCVSCGEIFHEDGKQSYGVSTSQLLTFPTEKQPLLGFPCGHVYHLSCILGETDSGMKRFEQTMASLGYQDTDTEQYHGRSVGAKVAHAHIIRTAVDRGCADCIEIDGS
ncbi:hypothetical protein MRB53_042196 [Persea americana]|nr:hypothetical protein MRB53_042196 [Persea americana]